MAKVLALIDGEHYPPVVHEALKRLGEQGEEIVGVAFLGGTEKVLENNNFATFGYPVITGPDYLSAVGRAINECRPEKVIDLSDEPIVGYRDRMNIASTVLAHNLVYLGADFEFRPPEFHDVARKPSMAIIGTGKRVGKTAISAFACRVLKNGGFGPVVVAMGRGGPAEPEVIRGDEIKIDAEYLLSQAQQGRHAASDHFEDALMSRIPTVGCRRCGGGMAGKPYTSNVLKGAEAANGLDGDFIVFEGSGAAMPPVATDTRVVVAGIDQRADYITGYLGPYRILLSDLVVLTNCEESVAPAKIAEVIAGIEQIKPGAMVVKTVFRPQPLRDISKKQVFFATTAPPQTGPILKDYLEKKCGAEVVGISHHLSNRPKLREDLAGCGGGFDILLTELKAAAVDVATAVGLEMGKEVVYCDNMPLSIEGGSLDERLVDLAKAAIAGFKGKRVGKEASSK